MILPPIFINFPTKRSRHVQNIQKLTMFGGSPFFSSFATIPLIIFLVVLPGIHSALSSILLIVGLLKNCCIFRTTSGVGRTGSSAAYMVIRVLKTSRIMRTNSGEVRRLQVYKHLFIGGVPVLCFSIVLFAEFFIFIFVH